MYVRPVRRHTLIGKGVLCLLALLPILLLAGCKAEEEGANDPNYYKGTFKRPGSSEGVPAKTSAPKTKGD